jgi:hypothetical protein
MYIFQTASRRHLLCCILFAIFFTLIARPQPVGATPQRHSLPYHPLTPTPHPIWSGYIATSAQATFTEVNMYFTVPTLTATPGKDTSVAIWDGVGGAKASTWELVQAGIMAEIDSNGTLVTPYEAVWEVINSDPNLQNGKSVVATPMLLDNGTTMYVQPGDQIWVYVGSGNSDHNNGYDGFLVEDLTQGTSAVHYEYDPNRFSDGGSAECIVERPTSTDPQTQRAGPTDFLANFGPNPIKITGCGVYTNSQPQYAMVPIGNFSPIQINMVDRNLIPLASTSDLRNGADFDVTWDNIGTDTSAHM